MGQRAETPVMCGAEGGDPNGDLYRVKCGAESRNPNGDLYRANCGAEGRDPNKVWG